MLRIALLYSLLFFTLLAHAEAEPYNRIDFQAEAGREVANDLLVASMSVEIQDRQPARVTQQINTVLNEALKQASTFGAVRAASGNQHTYPVYGKGNQLDAWRGRGEIHLESRDFRAAGELIMQLQSTMQVGNVQFTLSPDTRMQIENALIAEAIKAFQSRAEAIRAAMGAKAYKIVHCAINSSGMPPRYPVALMRSAAKANMAIPVPEFSGGESRMTVQINGTIEVQ